MKVTDEGLTVPSVVSELLRPTVTFAVGCDVSTIVKVAVLPASVTLNPLVGVTVNPADGVAGDPAGVAPVE